MTAMIVMADGVTLAADAAARHFSVGVKVPRFSVVDEISRDGSWSKVVVRTLAPAIAVSQPLSTRGPALSSTPVTPGITVGRANLGQRQLSQRQDGLSAAEGWIRSLALLPAGNAAGPFDLLTLYINRSLWELTSKYDNVTYSQEVRDVSKGSIDCSGWIQFANSKIYNDLDSEISSQLPKSFLASLKNTAAYQIEAFEKAGEALVSGDKLHWKDLLPGTLIAMNYSGSDPDRPHQIDHTVQVMYDPVTLAPTVTHSSFDGKGVNTHPLEKWFTGLVHKIGKDKLFAIDPYGSARASISRWIETHA